MAEQGRLAIVLFNLGGPDAPEAIRPFLLNLFRDPAILRVPFFVRPFLARLIASRRVKPATENYAILGGRSPLLELTRQQANALQAEFGSETRCFIAMRYWHPFAREVAAEVKQFNPDQILLLPLYPHFSTTTTGSSLSDWHEAAAAVGLVADTTTLCCWPSDPAMIAALAALIRGTWQKAEAKMEGRAKLRLLFSAHGLPESIIRHGDPYQFQIEQTAEALVGALAIPDLDWRICYQSRATPQKWLDPSTDTEVEQAGRDGVAVVVVPIAFVSEHSETLVELDVEYRELAKHKNVPGYFRVPAPNADPAFIAALAGIARRAVAHGPGLCSQIGARLCPAAHTDCPQR